MNTIQWVGLNGHNRTDEERLVALRWCEKTSVEVSFKGVHVKMKLPNHRPALIAYDLADCVKAAVENYGMPEHP